MILNTRRSFLSTAGAVMACANRAAAASTIRAVAFDGFAIFDPRPVYALVTELFPEQGKELVDRWRSRQFEYMWLRSLTGEYADFRRVTEDALVFAAASLAIPLPDEQRRRIMIRYLELKTWAEAPRVLRSLKDAGLTIALLSNMTVEMLESGIHNSKLTGVFDYLLSTDRVKTYKPDPRAYAMGTEALRLKKEEILFAAFAGWDASGAKTFGYPVYWVNRQNQPTEELGKKPDGTGLTLDGLDAWIKQGKGGRRQVSDAG